MSFMSKSSSAFVALAIATLPLSGGAFAQEQEVADESQILVEGEVPADLSDFPKGPEIEGFIANRKGSRMLVRTDDGSNTEIALSTATEVRARGGFLGMGSKELATRSLLNGLPVTVETVRWGNSLIASQIDLKRKDLRTAAMIHNGTDARFNAQGELIDANTAAAEALRGRMANIDQYNIKGTTNVYFDTGKWNLSGSAEQELCEAAAEANAIDNALLLVVGYTDSVGNEDYNQILSERRAGRVVNYLQQKCDWAPWRMLSPTGMAESDPLADNDTEEGRAQNRRVSVNILVSKAVEES